MLSKAPHSSEVLELEDLVTFRVARLSETLARGAVKLYTEGLGLGITEWRVMALLGRYAPLTANEISQRTGIDKSWISRSLVSLIAKGHVVRRADPSHGRKQLLALSPTGLAVYRRAAPRARQRHERLLDALSSEQRRRFLELLDLLQARAETILTEDLGSAAESKRK